MTFVIARGAVWDIKVNPPRLLSALDVLNELEAILEDFPNFSAESALWDPRIRFVFKDAARIHLGLEIEIQYRHQILKIDDLMQISSDYFILNMKMFPIRRSDYLGIAELLSQLGSIPPDVSWRILEFWMSGLSMSCMQIVILYLTVQNCRRP
jgi:hypothetical protein